MKTFFELNIIDWMLHITHLLHIGYEAFLSLSHRSTQQISPYMSLISSVITHTCVIVHTIVNSLSYRPL